MEERKLRAELEKLRAEAPPAFDVYEVRGLLGLTMDTVTCGGSRLYLTGGDFEKRSTRREAVIARTHPAKINALLRASNIITEQHYDSLVALFKPMKMPKFTLLYSGERVYLHAESILTKGIAARFPPLSLFSLPPALFLSARDDVPPAPHFHSKNPSAPTFRRLSRGHAHCHSAPGSPSPSRPSSPPQPFRGHQRLGH